MSEQKLRSVGKVVIVALAVAIFFFLLLPFLEKDSSTQTAAVEQQAKKATPQIYTSNPLGELVRKVYAIFSRDQRRKEQIALARAKQAQKAAQAQLTAANRARYAAENASSDPANAQTERAGEAILINEEGEWVLVRQTVPQAAQRGMHDISSKDDAYDTYVRLNQAAKYAAAAPVKKTEIPSSKWARVWQPIKNFFSGNGSKQSSGSMVASGNKSPLPGNSSSHRSATGLGFAELTRDFSGDGADNRPLPGGMFSSFATGNVSTNPIFFVLDSQGRISDIADQLVKQARSTLSGQGFQKANGVIQKEKNNLLALVKKHFQMALSKAASQSDPMKISSETLTHCSSSLVGLYSSSTDQCAAGSSPISTGEQVQEVQKRGQQELNNLLRKAIGIEKYNPTKPIDMLVLLGKTSASPMDEQKNLTESQKKFQYLYEQQGCNQQTCYWVGRAPEQEGESDFMLKNIVDSSGLAYLGDPLGVLQPLAQQYKQEQEKNKQQQGQNELSEEDMAFSDDEESEDDLDQNNEKWPAYIPYTEAQMNELNQRLKPGHDKKGRPTKPENPFLSFVPSAANAQNMTEVLPYLSLVIYDKPGTQQSQQILSEDNPANDVQRGEALRDRIEKRLDESSVFLKGAYRHMQQKGGKAIVQESLQQVQEDLKKAPSFKLK